MSGQAPARLPRGAREYLLERAERLGETIRTVTEAFETWGARRVVPTTFVDLETVEQPDTAITFAERETGRLLALRQDLTPQIRRIVDRELSHLPTPFRLYYMERVWADDPGHALRPKERIQAGIEWIGPAPGAEAALLKLVAELAGALDDARPTLIVGHAELRAAWLAALDLRDPAAADTALDRKDLSTWAAVGDPRFANLPLTVVDAKTPLAPEAPAAVAQLVAELQDATRAVADRLDVVIDPVARPEAGYYTGLFFALASGIAHDPWLRGGRYDGRFTAPVDALGFALDLDSVVEAADQGRMRCRRVPRVMWHDEGAAPACDDVRFLPLDPGVADPRTWAAAHGLDGIARREDGGRVVVRDPATNEPWPAQPGLKE